jgi:hypothetical protein
MKTISMAVVFAVAAAWPMACGNDNPPPPPENAGQACSNVAECYRETDGGAFMGGPALCLDVGGTLGYCTHLCSVDTDCCAVPGECKTAFPQVCSPFESRPEKYCLLSCEDVVISDAGVTDANAFCATYAHAGFTCRSSGGGVQNRKVCMP